MSKSLIGTFIADDYEIVKQGSRAVLAVRKRNDVEVEWVAWDYNFLRGDEVNCFWGHYFNNRESAEESFNDKERW